MPTPDKDKQPREKRPHRTGEDIDMLREKDSDPQSNDDRGSVSYRDNYDAA
jgi:hypothetical protein